MVINLPYPISNNRNARMVDGFMRTSKAAKLYKKEAGWIAKAAGCRILDGDLCVTVNYRPRINKDGTASKTRQDIDNVIKVTFDALNGICWHDDSQVVRLVAFVDEPVKDGGLTVMIEKHAAKEKV